VYTRTLHCKSLRTARHHTKGRKRKREGEHTHIFFWIRTHTITPVQKLANSATPQAPQREAARARERERKRILSCVFLIRVHTNTAVLNLADSETPHEREKREREGEHTQCFFVCFFLCFFFGVFEYVHPQTLQCTSLRTARHRKNPSVLKMSGGAGSCTGVFVYIQVLSLSLSRPVSLSPSLPPSRALFLALSLCHSLFLALS